MKSHAGLRLRAAMAIAGRRSNGNHSSAFRMRLEVAACESDFKLVRATPGWLKFTGEKTMRQRNQELWPHWKFTAASDLSIFEKQEFPRIVAVEVIWFPSHGTCDSVCTHGRHRADLSPSN
jgi:hypothetical protein